jgi:hypothetical protein
VIRQTDGPCRQYAVGYETREGRVYEEMLPGDWEKWFTAMAGVCAGEKTKQKRSRLCWGISCACFLTAMLGEVDIIF